MKKPEHNCTIGDTIVVDEKKRILSCKVCHQDEKLSEKDFNNIKPFLSFSDRLRSVGL